MAGTATTARTLVNSDPGPMTTWSAAAIASSAAAGGTGSGGISEMPAMPLLLATATWPSTATPHRRLAAVAVASALAPWP